MKKLYCVLVVLLIAMVLVSCRKDTIDPPSVDPTVISNPHSGLGQTPGYPTGATYSLPQNISIIGEIRGGIYGKEPLNKKTYNGPFNIVDSKANWVPYGTGTYVNLYIIFYNSSGANTTFTMPGGLIFIDSSDMFQHIPVYQKGFILQDVEISVNAYDSAFVQLRAYCINLSLHPSSYDAVYYIGPITNNADLNMIVNLMDGKQYPFGQEGSIQSIIWNVTDSGLTLTPAEIAYLTGLP
jgi:hypothetical protein